jgi:ketosteroid isomerase-like protein
MKKQLVLLAIICITTQVAWSQKPATDAIREVLANQEKAWNEGNIKTFMEGYWNNDLLVFTGSNGPVYGWQNTYNKYLKNYDTRDKMGKLTFSLLQFTPLGSDHYMVIGKFQLTRTIGDASGYFTLVFKNTKDGWKIMADHTS